MITMLLGGLWHGAGWGFLVWGGMQGFGLLAERIFARLLPAFRPHALVSSALALLLTQAWVTIAWVFFRAPSAAAAMHFIHAMFVRRAGQPVAFNNALVLPLVLSLAVVVHNTAPLWITKISRPRMPIFLGCTTAALVIADLLIFSPAKVFIYFRF